MRTSADTWYVLNASNTWKRVSIAMFTNTYATKVSGFVVINVSRQRCCVYYPGSRVRLHPVGPRPSLAEYGVVWVRAAIEG